MERQPSPSDVNDDKWAFVAPYLTLMTEEAPQRAHPLREVFHGLRWIVRAGAAGRMRPHDLPPWHTVYQQSQRGLKVGVFATLVHDLRAVLRLGQGRNAELSGALFDSRTLQSPPESGTRAGDEGTKRRRGSKVPRAVDALGPLWAVHVTAADAAKDQKRLMSPTLARIAYMIEALAAKIRDIKDFPKQGIVFKDITPLLGDPQAFNMTINLLADRYIGRHIDRVVGVEARGFILGAALAYKLNAGLILVRKPGKLPAETLKAAYELEYGVDTLEVHCDALVPGSQVVLVDDVIATGGTICAAIDLVQKMQCEIVEVAFLIELSALAGRKRLQGYNVFSLLQY